MTIWIILALTGVALIGALSARWMGPENKVEELAEAIIKQETGIDVDLSNDNDLMPQVKAQAVDLVKKDF